MLHGLDVSWKLPLQAELTASYMLELRKFLDLELKLGKVIFPHEDDWLHALYATPLDKVRVVVLGQDPYHGEGQAHGLSFSVLKGVRIPPSLTNIYKELKSDLDISSPPHGNLEAWANRGVLLLNTVLTVEAGNAGSHQNKGWENFTDSIIQLVNNQKRPIVFILWGKQAQKIVRYIDQTRHLVLQSAHPSPLSAHNGFFGSKPFSQANLFLKNSGQGTIDWSLPA